MGPRNVPEILNRPARYGLSLDLISQATLRELREDVVFDTLLFVRPTGPIGGSRSIPYSGGPILQEPFTFKV